jgi:nitroreductase
MSIIETIQKRRSVRTYINEPLTNEQIAQIREFINQLQTPFGAKARIELISVNTDVNPVKLGTYGNVKGASDFMALIYEEAFFAETAAAYMFEQAVLFCTDLDLGTCWLATFSRTDFKKLLQLNPNEQCRVVSPVGYASDKKRFLEKYIVNADKKHASRKPFEELFFHQNFDNPLTNTSAGIFLQPLEMVRLAPSANNKQEWRVLLEDKAVHFYKNPYPMFDAIDMGIALCHFELTCKELDIEGKFEILTDFPKNEKLKYVISWI